MTDISQELVQDGTDAIGQVISTLCAFVMTTDDWPLSFESRLQETVWERLLGALDTLQETLIRTDT